MILLDALAKQLVEESERLLLDCFKVVAQPILRFLNVFPHGLHFALDQIELTDFSFDALTVLLGELNQNLGQALQVDEVVFVDVRQRGEAGAAIET